MGRAVSIDGSLTPPGEAKVSVYDRGFLYGDGVFETLRTYRGAPFALLDHLDRLESSARAVGIGLPVSTGTLEAEIRQALSEAANPESYLRLMLTRGQGPMGLDPALATDPLRVILVEPLSPLPASIYRDGVPVITERTERASDAAPGAKVMNYLAGMLALQRAKAKGAHEALMLDVEGYVLEGATSNFFLVIDGEILTTPSSLVLPGITRAHVIRCAEREGIGVRFGSIGQGDLNAATEAFLTSSLREIVPVVRVDRTRIGDGKPGRLTRKLHLAYRGVAGIADWPLPWE